MPMSWQMWSDFLKLSLHNTHGQLKASCHYQIYQLEEFKWISIHVKSTKRKSVTFLKNKTRKKKKKCINYFCTEYIADMHGLRTNHNHQPYSKYNFMILNGLNLLQVVFSPFLHFFNLEFDLCSLGNSLILYKIYL